MESMTATDIAKLTYPFRREDHDFLEGYVYISEEAITERIERIDPLWTFSIDELIALGDSVICRATLTIKGVSRSNVGGNPIQRDKADKDSNGNKTGSYSSLPLYTIADNGVNAHKAAATDALKRSARSFGIGRYLLSAPKTAGNNTDKFDEWLKIEHQQAKAVLDTLTKPVIDLSTGEITHTEAPPPQQPASTGNAPTSPTSVSQTGIPAGSVPNGLQSSTGTTQPGSGGSDQFAQKFPATVKATPDALYDRTHDYFNARKHFDNFWQKHIETMTAVTVDEAVLFVKQAHWNYDKEQCIKLVDIAKNAYAMTVNEVMQALTDAGQHSVKTMRDWDGGNFTVAQAALLAWKSGFEAQRIQDNAEGMGIEQGVTFEALVICQQYQRTHQKDVVPA